MSENKHYGRQILLSLFLTVFILLGLLYLASRYLLPLYSINQSQIYGVLVKLFPLLIGLIMIEVGVLISRKRDEDLADEIDKLPPNAYDKPLYTLPGDDPLHRHSDGMIHSQSLVDAYHIVETPLAPEDELHFPFSTIQPQAPIVEQLKPDSFEDIVTPERSDDDTAELRTLAPGEKMAVIKTFSADFASILANELDNAQELNYELTLVLIDVSKGPAEQITNKILMLSGELAYSFILENNRMAMVLPFYNADEARSFTLTLLESCKKEFTGSSLQIGFASRNGRLLDSSQLLHEAEAACMLEDDKVAQEEVLQEEVLQEEVLQEEVLQEEVLQEEVLQEEVLQEEVLQEKVLQEEVLQEEVLQEEVLQEEDLEEEDLQEEDEDLIDLEDLLESEMKPLRS